MPNWVYNTLTVEGNPESVIKLKEQVGKPFTQSIQANGDLAYSVKEVNYSNPIFAFWNIVAPTDLDAYHKQPDFSSDKPYGGDDWYSWNTRNWGVKWDVAVADGNEYPDTHLYTDEVNGDNHVLVYGFETAWGTPIAALEKLSAQYPELLFTLTYEEETGWGGEDEFLAGSHNEGSSYNWKCRECNYEETDEPPYCEECEFDTCPSCGYNESSNPCDSHKEAKQ
jgi:hypothetical protein